MSGAAQAQELQKRAAEIIATSRQGSLATRLARGDQPVGVGFPYVSLVLLAPDEAGRPFLLLSDLSEHAQNLQANPDLALLLEQSEGKPDPLAEPRLTLLGRARQITDDEEQRRLRAAFVAAHPRAKVWAEFADFKPYRIDWLTAHFVAGFGRIAWLDAAAVMGLLPVPEHQG